MVDYITWSKTRPYRMKMRLLAVLQCGAGLSVLLEPNTVAALVVGKYMPPILFTLFALIGAVVILYDGARGQRLNGTAVTPLTVYLAYTGGAGFITSTPIPLAVTLIYGAYIVEIWWMIWHNARGKLDSS